jgi:glycosyltransferase involved in cell wall biosynthesis
VKVGYDTAPLALNQAGERRYAAALLNALEARGDVEITRLTLVRRRPRGLAQRLAWQAAAEGLYYPLLVGRRARAAGVELVHHPRHLVPPELGLGVPSVVTVHDVLPLRTPEHFSQLIARRYSVLARVSTRRAARVITGSEHSRDEIAELLDVPVERIRVTPYGVEPVFRPVDADLDRLARRFGVRPPYVLCVGTLEPRKNLTGAVRAFERIHAEFPDHSLVLIGGRGWKSRELERLLSATSAPVVRTGYVEEEELVELYSGADCFLFPSFAEGFGFPALEAMACGTPVVAGAGSSLPEVVGDAGLLADPGSTEAIADALRRVLGSPELRDDLRSRGLERSRAFTWERCAEATAVVYRELVEAGDGSPR